MTLKSLVTGFRLLPVACRKQTGRPLQWTVNHGASEKLSRSRVTDYSTTNCSTTCSKKTSKEIPLRKDLRLLLPLEQNDISYNKNLPLSLLTGREQLCLRRQPIERAFGTVETEKVGELLYSEHPQSSYYDTKQTLTRQTISSSSTGVASTSQHSQYFNPCFVTKAWSKQDVFKDRVFLL